MAGDIYMNEAKGVKIKKVRCYAPTVVTPLHIRQQRDMSKKEYKQQYNVTLDGNYCMAIYEGIIKGKMKRTYEIINMIDASNYYKESSGLTKLYPIAPEEKNGMKYRCKVTTGTQIILLQSDDEEIDLTDSKEVSARMYYVAIMKKDGRLILRHNQEARDAGKLAKESRAGAYKTSDSYRSQIALTLSDFHALVEGVDFDINVLGEIKRK
jgi:CRISPR-associated endonuclease Csn1